MNKSSAIFCVAAVAAMLVVVTASSMGAESGTEAKYYENKCNEIITEKPSGLDSLHLVQDWKYDNKPEYMALEVKCRECCNQSGFQFDRFWGEPDHCQCSHSRYSNWVGNY